MFFDTFILPVQILMELGLRSAYDLTQNWGLSIILLSLVVSLIMEALDLRDGYAWGESLKDIINTNAIPFILVALARWRVFNI